MVRILTLLLTFSLYGLAFPSQAQAINVTASVDKNPVIVNESFTLTIAANDDLPQSAFRSAPLMQDFVVGATSVDRSTRLIQGQMSRQTRWQVTLVARQSGTYQIPSFEIEGNRTQAIEIEVIEPSAADTGSRGPVFLTAEVDTASPYIQQQIRYKVSLHIAHQLESGSISPPSLDNSDIQQVGQDQESQQIIDGQRYRVITRNYIVTPRRSGSFVLEGSRFDGQVREQQPRSFTGFSRPQSVTVLAPDIELEVAPQPSGYEGRWLPSRQVAIEDEWEEDKQLTLGEPVTRRITITAQGVHDEQLPDISPDYPAQLRYYPERTERESYSAQGERIAQASFRGAIIATEEGNFTLPAIEVNWWNTETGEQETARIPERQVEVVAPPGGVPSPRAMDIETFSSDAAPLDQEEQPTNTTPANQPQHWWSPAASLFAALWFITLLCCIWLYLRQRTSAAAKPEKAGSGQVPAPSRKPLQRLKLACKQNNARDARKALLNWANSRHPENQLNNLDSLARQLQDTELNHQIHILQQCLYNGRELNWEQGDKLWQSIQRLHHQSKRQSDDAKLPPLYPAD
ncbi:hypothetical protein CWE09_00380 [Aliidiomarina minuta]|uniref:DUF7939 domain-containing protein n=1 Tax=Aliidiomarina minuta TaxID=880057 RepID=A0A432W585_9GAMM|nr:BatD family protein [Aliidiomarina minuta]RUO25234.1 hypothetical protein CWE09_00380 [Aliidiomarina minuta]